MFTSSFTPSTIHPLNRRRAAKQHIRPQCIYRHQIFAPNSPRALAAYHTSGNTSGNISVQTGLTATPSTRLHPAIQAPMPQTPITAAALPAILPATSPAKSAMSHTCLRLIRRRHTSLAAPSKIKTASFSSKRLDNG